MMDKAYEAAKKLKEILQILLWYENDPQRRAVFDKLEALADAVMSEIDYYQHYGKGGDR